MKHVKSMITCFLILFTMAHASMAQSAVESRSETVLDVLEQRDLGRAELKQLLLDIHNYQQEHGVEVLTDEAWVGLQQKADLIRNQETDEDRMAALANKIYVMEQNYISISRFLELYRSDRDELLGGNIR